MRLWMGRQIIAMVDLISISARISNGKRKFPVLILACLLLLTSCASVDQDLPSEPEEGVLIYAALNPITNGLQARVDAFNDSHTDVQIEIRDYSDENGPQRLLVELTAGRIPDIMELQRLGTEAVADDKEAEVMWHTSPLDADLSGCYWMPYQRLVQKGYLEDLWPYIENDPDLGREGVLEAPLKAAEVDGGLYMLFREVSINTLVGAESVIGDRRGWTVEELMEAFSNMSADSTVLHYDTVRSKVFFALLGPTLSQYVNWNTGQCSFDSKEFRSMVEFLKCFPAEFDSSLSGGLVNFNCFSGEPVMKLEAGCPMLLRHPLAPLTLGNFARAQLYAAMAPLRMGMELLEEEQVALDKLYGHGGLFKVPEVAPRLMASALDVPVAVLETAGEGGPWGMALLAMFRKNRENGESLEDYLSHKVFANSQEKCQLPDEKAAEGFALYLRRYKAALPAQKAGATVWA